MKLSSTFTKINHQLFSKSLCLIVALLATSCSRVGVNVKPKEPEVQKPAEVVPAPELGLLTVAAFDGDIELAKSLLDKGAYINENIGDDDANQINPLIAAAVNNKKEMIRFLLDRGASMVLRYKGFAPEDISNHQSDFGTLREFKRTVRTK